MTPLTSTMISLISQVSENGSSGGGTMIIAIAAIVAGFLTGICIWRADKKRCIEAEEANVRLAAELESLRS